MMIEIKKDIEKPKGFVDYKCMLYCGLMLKKDEIDKQISEIEYPTNGY